MNADRLPQIEEIYHTVLEVAPEQRAALLASACGDDEELRREVESLLSFAEVPSNLIDNPPLDVAAEIFAEKNRSKIVGTKIRQYEILSLIGSGGMGEVFLARDTRLERQVAVKFINLEFAQDPDRLRRFFREAKTASALNHPNIITVHEIGKTKKTQFIATEFIDGKTLRKAMSEGPLTFDEMLDIAAQVAAALNAAHAAGIFHRDIKPENIMLRGDKLVKVLDFGLAKLMDERPVDPETLRQGEVDEPAISASPRPRVPVSALPPVPGSLLPTVPVSSKTEAGLVMGTVAYMSPEQAGGKRTDARSDIWSLGVVLYEMCGGRQPFAGETTREMIASILQGEPAPLGENVPAGSNRIIRKALQKNPDDRYQTAQDLIQDLKDLRRDRELTLTTEPRDNSASPVSIDLTSPNALRVSAANRLRTNTGEYAKTRTTRPSSAEYIFYQIKRHKLASVASVVFLIAVSVSAFFYLKRPPILTNQDTILIADFENLTDDPVFTGTLKQGLALELSQSPFLRIAPEAEMKETLRSIGKSANEKITPAIAREICLRQGVKVFITGSFAPRGNHYLVTLQVINAQTGGTIISEQNQADSKAQVLGALHKTATSLREKLGESLASIKKFDTQSEVATTSSLEAMRAYSMGMEAYAKGGNKDEAVVSLFQLAIKLDPNFALAYRDLARHQFNIGRPAEAAASIAKAFELRERTSENEKFSIVVLYYEFAAHDLAKAAETAELWKRTFPRFWQPWHSLADIYFTLGQYDKALENGLEAIRLNPNFAAAYTNPGGALVRLNRLGEAKDLYARAMANNLDHLGYHLFLFWISYFEHDPTAIQQQLDWMRTHDYQHFAFSFESQLALLEGRWQQSLEFSRRARAAAVKYGEQELVASSFAADAHANALFGDCRSAKQLAREVLPLTANNSLLADAAFTLAMCGEESQALKIAAELDARFPQERVLHELRLPTVRAAVELHRGRPDQALELLESTKSYRGANLNFAPFVSGLALLQKGKNAEAATEFQRIYEHASWFESTPLIPLSHLWEARAVALTGDRMRSRQAYDQFFALWKDADADLPILVEARKEYARIGN